MIDTPADVAERAREAFLKDSGFASNPAASREVEGIRAGKYDDYPMLRIARSAILAERERCASIVDAEFERVLGQQDGKDRAVDQQLRMMVALLPEVASSIRAGS